MLFLNAEEVLNLQRYITSLALYAFGLFIYINRTTHRAKIEFTSKPF